MQIKCKQAIRLRIEGPTDNKVAFCLEAGCELEAGSSDSAQKAWNSVRLSRESWDTWAPRGQRLVRWATWTAQNSAAYDFSNLDSDSILHLNTSNIFCRCQSLTYPEFSRNATIDWNSCRTVLSSVQNFTESYSPQWKNHMTDGNATRGIRAANTPVAPILSLLHSQRF